MTDPDPAAPEAALPEPPAPDPAASDPAALASAIAAAQAALGADPVVQGTPPGTPARRERMREIIHALAAEWGVERADLTMALTQLSARAARGQG